MTSKTRTRLGRVGGYLRDVFRRYFVAGVLFFAPIGITLWAIFWIIGYLDRLLLPRVLGWIGISDPPILPFVGALFTLLVILFMGVIARHLLPFQITRRWTRLIDDIPIAGSIYGAVRQLFEAIFQSEQGSRFNRVILIEYPRRGLFALAFTTGEARGIVQDVTPEKMINCFVPTTPNPTSGFYLLVPEPEVRAIDLTVEEAFKLVMSAGLVAPEDAAAEGASLAPAAPMPRPVEEAS
ncbi:MAG: DUF502 domain-containing protein [Myxococcales bacterium]|nr:DUF502 domain-containing protein [Myxococcales bacterium]